MPLRIAAIALSVLLLASIGMNVYQFLRANSQSQELSALSAELPQVEQERDEALSRADALDEALTDKDAELDRVRSDLSAAESELEQANAKLDGWRERAEEAESELAQQPETSTLYDEIAAYARGTNPGGSSKVFKVSEPVIVMRLSDPERTFTLTTDFYAGSIVEMEPSGDAATVSFTQSSWGSTTPMKVKPNHVGTTVCTFTNDYNTQVFTMLVIVVE